MGEIRQANFRIDTESAKAFREFCDQQGFNQSEGFSYLLKTLELDQAKNQLPERSTEVKQFEQSIKTLQALYLSSLELNANSEVRVKEQFLADLSRKDKTIDELREKITSLEKQKTDLEATAKEAVADKVIADEQKNNAVERLEATKKSYEDAERINIMISAKLAEAEQKLDGYEDLKSAHEKSIATIMQLNQDIESLKQQHASEIEILKKDGELSITRALASKEQELQASLQIERSRADRALGQLEAASEHIKELKEQIKELNSRK